MAETTLPGGSAPGTQPQEIPEAIGSYAIEERIGAGGMGVVLRAFHKKLERHVALKRIRPELAGQPFRRRAFRQEAKIIAQLSHPNVVQIYDFLEEGDCTWIVMELVEGPTLTESVSEGPMDIKTAVDLGLEISRGLAAAHSTGIVHRDLKLANVKLDREGRPKILDFGIAQLLSTAQEGSGLKTAGTPHAMSPEQVAGLRLDHRSDLFSLGSLLYELLSGKSPFGRPVDSADDVLRKVGTYQPPPLRKLDGNIPPPLSDLVDHLLEKDPNNRPKDVQEVILQLQRLPLSDYKTPRILFVDDEPDFEVIVRQAYRRALRRQELSLEFARNGQEALDQLSRTGDFDLVITDLKMPRMDGLTFLSSIHRQYPDLVTVVVSAYGDIGNIRSAMGSGAFDFLIKPVDLGDLEEMRKKALEEVQARAERHRLRQENSVLMELHRFAESRFKKSLSQAASEQSSWISQGEFFPSTTHAIEARLVISELETFSDRADLKAGVRFFSELLTTVIDACRRHQATPLQYQEGELKILFNDDGGAEAETRRAVDFTESIISWAESFAPEGGSRQPSLEMFLHLFFDRDALSPGLLSTLESRLPGKYFFEPQLGDTTLEA